MEKNYIPKNNGDLQAVEFLKLRSFESIRKDVPSLLECIADLHWQIARPVFNYLSPHLNEIQDDILKILGTNDIYWIRSIMVLFITVPSFKPNKEILEKVKRIYLSPTGFEKEEDMDEIAERLLKIHSELANSG